MTTEHEPIAIRPTPENPLYRQTLDLDRNEGAIINQMRATHIEQFPDPVIDVPGEFRRNIFVGSIDALLNWGRKSSVFPLMMGLACCSFEMIAAAMSRFDLSRFGMEVFRASPRQADLMIVSGTVTKKMVPQIVRLYNQMPEPRYVLAMGACASGGG